MSETETYPKAEFIRKPKYRMFRSVDWHTTFDSGIALKRDFDLRSRAQIMFVMSETETYPKAEFVRKPNLSEYRMFRSVDWTHDMIIVKWHLHIWQERKFCALTNRPPAQSTRTGQRLSTLFHANCSASQVYVLPLSQFIFALSCKWQSISFQWTLRRIFLNIFGVSDDDKYYGGIMSRPRNYKNFEFDSGKRE